MRSATDQLSVRRLSSCLCFLLISVLVPALSPAEAKAGERIYVFVDERGVPTFSNYQPDPKFKPYKPARGAVYRHRSLRAYGGYSVRMGMTIDRFSSIYGVDPDLVRAMVQVESDFDPNAVSPKGARGLMQLMPRTAALYRVRDPFDPRENLKAGILHVRRLMDRFRGDIGLVLAAYNAGEEKVRLHRGIPPYPETRRYVRRVMDLYRKSKGLTTTR